MSRFYSYINTSCQVLSGYKGEMPFSYYLKEFFTSRKKFGSRDRKQIAQLCYSFFRTGHALKAYKLEDAVLLADLLCANPADDIIRSLKPEWIELAALPLEEKMKRLLLAPEQLFPFSIHISKEIELADFRHSLSVQPNLFVRIRPGHKMQVQNKLTEAGITFQEIGEECLGFLNATKIGKVLELDEEVVIQDKSSQQVGELMKVIKEKRAGEKLDIWDCCAASGGKSLMAWDILGSLNLTVTDVRRSILSNLEKRFRSARIHPYQVFITDLSDVSKRTVPGKFDLVIADVPCTGSGTWARTPEQLYYFREEKIDEYAALQNKIISKVWQSLKSGGYLLYITCSIFEKENEQQVQRFCRDHAAILFRSEYFKGYKDKADTLYAALLQKSL